MNPIIIIGAGGHARVLYDACLLQRVIVLGFTDSDKDKWQDNINQITILGNDEIIRSYAPEKILLVNGLGSVSEPSYRKSIYKYWKKKGYCFANVIHPQTIISRDCQFGEGVQIMAGAIIQTGCILGDNVLINTGSQIDHDNNIGSHSHIAPGAVLSGNVQVGEGCHLGIGCNILQGIAIGERSVIGAGAVVLHDVDSESRMVGIPARRMTL